MAAAGVTEVRVLAGTISVTSPEGGTVEPRGKTAQLLALLVSHAPHPVTVNDIIMALWDVHDPALIDKRQVEKLVSGLRNLFGDGARTAIPPRKHEQYVFDVGATDMWVDAFEFDRLAQTAQARLESGDAAGARADGLQALELWASDPVVLPQEWKQYRDRRRLLRLSVAEAAVRTGSFADVAAELEVYVDDDPRDERGWELLVEAYLGGDRPVDARRACSRAARELEPHGGMGPTLRGLSVEADKRHGGPPPAAAPVVTAGSERVATAPPSRPEPLVAPVARRRSSRRRRWWWLAVTSGVLGAVVAVLLLRDNTSAPPNRAVVPVGPSDSIAFDFDSGLRSDGAGRYVLDSTMQHRGYEFPNSGGTVTLVDHDGGKAVKFPPACGPGATTSVCAGAVIDVANTGSLNPGTRPFSYGADVLADPKNGPRGPNIMQKGNGLSRVNTAPNQWKLELAPGGEARCTLVTKATDAISAKSTVPITDGRWHKVRCTRRATILSIEVDGADLVSVGVPRDMGLTSGEPLRLAGSNRMGTDRFTGAVDNVFYRLD